MNSVIRSTFATRFIRYLVPLAIAVGGFLWISYRETVRSRLAELSRSEEKYVALLKESVTDDFQAIVTDLKVLVNSDAVRRSLTDETPQGKALLAEELRRFAQQKGVYDQIRILHLDGMEAVRINFVQGTATIVDDGLLQSKQDRYYFQATKDLPDDHVFVSPFDLNVEDGKIEQPLKPTIRFGAPVIDLRQQRRGILVLNYLGQRMLDRFGRIDADSPGRAMLLNRQGYWLYADQPQRAWGFMLSDRATQVFPQIYPEAWNDLQSLERGQVRLGPGLFTFETVRPFRTGTSDGTNATNASVDESGRNRQWKVVSLVSSEMLNEHLMPVRRLHLVLTFALLTGATLGSGALARFAEAREQSERALRASEARFRQMADAINEVFWLSGSRRRELQYVSPAFASIWGVQANTVMEVADRWVASIYPDDRALAEVAWNPSRDCEKFEAEYRIRRDDGELRWVRDQGFAIHDERGNVVGYAGIADDVTDMMESQRRMLQSERLAAIGEAITGIAHESRNALQRSQACLEMLARRIADRPEASELAGRIQQALRELHLLYQRVRDYAAPLQLQPVGMPIRPILQQTLSDLSSTIETRGARIVETIQPPATDETLQAQVDHDALKQVFRNVLENALDGELDRLAQRTEVRIDVTWSHRKLEERPAIELRIEDNGPGFHEGQGERIFEPFFTTKTRGTGLGMAISRRIINALGGTITADNQPGRGLQIIITLPAILSREVQAMASDVTAPAANRGTGDQIVPSEER